MFKQLKDEEEIQDEDTEPTLTGAKISYLDGLRGALNKRKADMLKAKYLKQPEPVEEEEQPEQPEQPEQDSILSKLSPEELEQLKAELLGKE